MERLPKSAFDNKDTNFDWKIYLAMPAAAIGIALLMGKWDTLRQKQTEEDEDEE